MEYVFKGRHLLEHLALCGKIFFPLHILTPLYCPLAKTIVSVVCSKTVKVFSLSYDFLYMVCVCKHE